MDNGHNHPPGDDSPGRQADERLVHALLVHLHDDRAVSDRERRVGQVIQAIRSQVPAADTGRSSAAAEGLRRTSRPHRWTGRVLWAAAAVVLVAVGAWILTYSPAPAMASLNDILNALGRPGDRTYRLQMVEMPAPPEGRPRDTPSPQTVPRPGLDGATLYLRDATQYVLVRNDPKGGVVLDGYDGRQSWRIRNGRLAEIRDGLGAGGIPIPPMMADVPFSDLHGTLARIRVDYTVHCFDEAPLPSGGEKLRHVLARRNSREVKGPETIEIWADPQTGLPRHIVFDRAKFQGSPEPHRLTVELTSEAPLPADWFAPTPHVTADPGGVR
jgi:hypothetical protein